MEISPPSPSKVTETESVDSMSSRNMSLLQPENRAAHRNMRIAEKYLIIVDAYVFDVG